jgi:ribosomal protein S6
MQKLYESMVVLKTDITEEQKAEVFSKITKKIEELQGTVKVAKVWASQRAFSFPLVSRGAEKKRHASGCYWLVEFDIDGQKLGELKEALRLDERVLRSTILRREAAVVKA